MQLRKRLIYTSLVFPFRIFTDDNEDSLLIDSFVVLDLIINSYFVRLPVSEGGKRARVSTFPRSRTLISIIPLINQRPTSLMQNPIPKRSHLYKAFPLFRFCFSLRLYPSSSSRRPQSIPFRLALLEEHNLGSVRAENCNSPPGRLSEVWVGNEVPSLASLNHNNARFLLARTPRSRSWNYTRQDHTNLIYFCSHKSPFVGSRASRVSHICSCLLRLNPNSCRLHSVGYLRNNSNFELFELARNCYHFHFASFSYADCLRCALSSGLRCPFVPDLISILYGFRSCMWVRIFYLYCRN